MNIHSKNEDHGIRSFIHVASGSMWHPITSRQIDGETMETVTDLIFLGSTITADGDCTHEI